MPAWLAKTTDIAKATWNTIASVGPWLISQSDTASETFARHQGRLAAVEVGKEFLVQEVHVLGEAKKKLLEKWVEANPGEKVRIRRDMEEIDASLRGLNIGRKALEALQAPSSGQSPPSPDRASGTSSSPEITAHWLDKFRDLSQSHNEPWREDLLARALAAEAANPGEVPPRILWLMGTLEERVFKAFACILDLSSVANKSYILPTRTVRRETVPDCELGEGHDISKLLYYVKDSGLLGDYGSQLHHQANKPFALTYREHCCVITATVDTYIGGILPSYLGNQIARFCTPAFNNFGKLLFDEWIAGLDRNNYEVWRARQIGPENYQYIERI